MQMSHVTQKTFQVRDVIINVTIYGNINIEEITLWPGWYVGGQTAKLVN